MKNNQFDRNRFLLLLRLNLKLNRNFYIACAITAFGFALVLDILYNQSDGLQATSPYNIRHFSVAAKMSFIFYYFLMLSSSMAFSAYRTPKQRIGQLTMPATYLEKYLANVLPVTVGTLVMMSLCLMSVYVLFLPLHQTVTLSDMLLPLSNSWTQFSARFAMMSFSVLGATLWHKNNFIYTVICTLLLSIPFSFVLALCLGKNILMTSAPLTVCFYSVIAVYCIVLSYFRFKEMEVISRF